MRSDGLTRQRVRDERAVGCRDLLVRDRRRRPGRQVGELDASVRGASDCEQSADHRLTLERQSSALRRRVGPGEARRRPRARSHCEASEQARKRCVDDRRRAGGARARSRVERVRHRAQRRAGRGRRPAARTTCKRAVDAAGSDLRRARVRGRGSHCGDCRGGDDPTDAEGCEHGVLRCTEPENT